jgi:hypothetical protein
LRTVSTSLARQNQLAMRPIPKSRNVDGSGLTVGAVSVGEIERVAPATFERPKRFRCIGNVGMPCSRLLVCPSAYRWIARIPIFRLSKSVTNTEQKTLPMFLSSQGEWIIWSGINSHDRLKPSSTAGRSVRKSCVTNETRFLFPTSSEYRTELAGSRAGVKRKARANSFIRENCNTVPQTCIAKV